MSVFKFQFSLCLFLAASMLIFSGCVPDGEDESSAYAEGEESVEMAEGNGDGGCELVTRPTMEQVGNGMVELRPANGNYRGDILVLPAWGDPRDTWCHRSGFCSMAQDKGYRLIFPDMGKSIYISQHYKETREDWRSFPTYTWLRDSLIPEMQERHCLLNEKGNNFVVGLSAGARGAIKLVQDLPQIFVAAAALSGDYDPGQMKGDNIYRGFLGGFDQFPERWQVTENVVSGADRVKAPLFLAHGKDDPLVSYAQTENLYRAIREANPELAMRLNLVSGQMDGYEFWNSQIDQLLAFFEDTQANRPESP